MNLFLWTVEALGGAELPSAANVNRIRGLNRTLSSNLTPRRIGRFFDLYPEYNRRQGRFVRDMRLYLDRVIGGTGRLVTGTEIVRDASFLTLSACAAVLSAGASTAAEAAAVSVGTALMRTAAANVLIAQIEHSATNMGRTMAGERVTYRETGDQIVQDAVNALTGAGLGQVIGHFLEPLTGNLTTLALREIERGSLLRGMSVALSDAQLGNVIGQAIQRMFREAVEPLRRALSRCSPSGGERAYAREMSEALMQDRNFRRILQEEIEASA